MCIRDRPCTHTYDRSPFLSPRTSSRTDRVQVLRGTQINHSHPAFPVRARSTVARFSPRDSASPSAYSFPHTTRAKRVNDHARGQSRFTSRSSRPYHRSHRLIARSHRGRALDRAREFNVAIRRHDYSTRVVRVVRVRVARRTGTAGDDPHTPMVYVSVGRSVDRSSRGVGAVCRADRAHRAFAIRR